MAEVVLREVGSDKEKVAEKYSEVTGAGMEEAKKAMESVAQGNVIILTIPDPENVSSIIQQFSDVGAVVSENKESIGESAVNNVSQEMNETEDKNGQYEIAEQKTEEEVVEGEVVETLELGVAMVDLDDISNAGRNTILPVLDDVCKVSEHIDNLVVRMKKIEDEIKQIRIEASNAITPPFSLGSIIIVCISAPICIFILINIMNSIGFLEDLGMALLAFLIAIVGGIGAGLMIAYKIAYITNYEQIQVQEKEYLNEHLTPKLEKEKSLKKCIEEYLSSTEVFWAVNVVGEEYFNTEIIRKLTSLITSRRADSLKEALNLYETIKYQENMQNMQSSILELTNAGVEAAKEQATYAKQIEKNTAVAAMAAVANANANAATAATAKKIYKEIKR